MKIAFVLDEKTREMEDLGLLLERFGHDVEILGPGDRSDGWQSGPTVLVGMGRKALETLSRAGIAAVYLISHLPREDDEVFYNNLKYPGIYKAVTRGDLVEPVKSRCGVMPIYADLRDITPGKAKAFELMLLDILKAEGLKRTYAKAVELCLNRKVAEFGPADPMGTAMIAGAAKQVVVFNTMRDPSGLLEEIPNVRVVENVSRAFDEEEGAFDAVVDLRPSPGENVGLLLERYAGLLNDDGFLLYGDSKRMTVDSCRKFFGLVSLVEPGLILCYKKRREEIQMSEGTAWNVENREMQWDPPKRIPAPPLMGEDTQPLSGDAEAELDNLIKSLEESVSKVHNTAAQALIAAGQYKKALEHSEVCHRFGYQDPESLNTLGWLRYIEGDDKGALEAFDKALSLDPGNGDVLYNKGMVLYSLGNQGEAASCWEESIRNGCVIPDVYNNLGVVRHGQGRLQEAKELFQKALEIDPGYREAKENLEALESLVR